MHNLFLYFVNLYMFRAYLCPSSGGTTVCIQQLVLIILFRRLSVFLVGLELHTVVPPDDRPRYARNMQRLTKYTQNKLCIRLVFFIQQQYLVFYDMFISGTKLSMCFYVYFQSSPNRSYLLKNVVHFYSVLRLCSAECDIRGLQL